MSIESGDPTLPCDVKELVRKEGLEPPRPFGHKILSLARLPVPPLPQWFHQYTGNRPRPAISTMTLDCVSVSGA
jgi:hypothetical protein